jgi:hypothetical protein
MSHNAYPYIHDAGHFEPINPSLDNPYGNAAYAEPETLNGRKSTESYGLGDCVTFVRVHPDSRFREIGDVAILDDKDPTGNVLPVTTAMAHALVRYVSQPDIVIPGTDTTSYYDDIEKAMSQAVTHEDVLALISVLEAEDTDPHGYDIIADHPALGVGGWVRTSETEDCIELGAVDPASPVRAIGCTAMRDSRFPHSVVRIFNAKEMTEFAAGAKRGEFDDPAAPSTHPLATPRHLESSRIEDGQLVVTRTPLPLDYDPRNQVEVA